MRNGPIGIASADVLPRSFGSRMSIGICPPSNPAAILCEPERDFCPLIPRPEYRPLPDPRPRPTRLRSFRGCAGRSEWRLSSSIGPYASFPSSGVTVTR